ncbi:MAG: DUF4105 domain-containing protein [Pseudomonadota bacterium]
MWVKPILLAAGLAAGLFLLIVYTKAASHDRHWQPHLGKVPQVDQSGDIVRITPIRDWTYSIQQALQTAWVSEGVSIDLSALKQVWFVVEPHPGIPMMAHTLVLFEFDDGDLIGLTIEARKQIHETYNPVAGAFRRYELIYVWAEPRDLLTRRAVMLDHQLYIYPLDLSRAQARAYLEGLVERTAEIERRPRFYNTLISNCTNELAKSAGLAWQPAFVLTGRSAEALHRAGYISASEFEDARASADMTEAVQMLVDASVRDFNTGLLSALSARP